MVLAGPLNLVHQKTHQAPEDLRIQVVQDFQKYQWFPMVRLDPKDQEFQAVLLVLKNQPDPAVRLVRKVL